MKAFFALPSLYKSTKPRSKLSSVPLCPSCKIGSAMVTTVLLTVVVVPVTVRLGTDKVSVLGLNFKFVSSLSA